MQAGPSDGKGGNNFVPSSNISTFLLSKGSSGSLNAFENDYSYRINLENIGSGNSSNNPTLQMMNSQYAKGQQNKQVPHFSKKQKNNQNINGANQIFSEVIVEDEDENWNDNRNSANQFI